jgi:hypothetical protein
LFGAVAKVLSMYCFSSRYRQWVGSYQNLVELGDISGIKEFIAELSQQNCCPRLTAKLHELSESFNLNALYAFLKSSKNAKI